MARFLGPKNMSALSWLVTPPDIPIPVNARTIREGLNANAPLHIAIGKPEVRKQEIMDVFVKHPAKLSCSFIAGAMEFRNVTHVRKLLRELVTEGRLGTQMRERGNGRSLILYFVFENR